MLVVVIEVAYQEGKHFTIRLFLSSLSTLWLHYSDMVMEGMCEIY